MYLLIPAKATWLAKKRLSPILTDEERAIFTRWLLGSLLSKIYESGLNLQPLLLTSDSALGALAAPYGYPTLPDPLGADLNGVLEQGRTYAISQGATSLLVLPTDLPYLTSEALRGLVAHAAGQAPCVLIAPDREGEGTNALLLRPADAIPFRFGIGSAILHRSEAEQRGIPVFEYRDPAFAQDIDVPEHYQAMIVNS